MKKEVSCINTKAILEYVKVHNQGDLSALLDNLDPEIDILRDRETFLKDPNNWISSHIACKLLERSRTILNDEMATYKIARFAIENSALGYIQKTFVKAFWSYKKALKHAQKINDKFNRSKKIELVQFGMNGAVVRLYWNTGMELSKDLCWMNHGIYTFMPLIWGGKPLELREKHCFFNGDPYCEYHLKWPARNRVHEIFSRFFKSKSVLSETIKEMEEDKKLIEHKYEEVKRLNIELKQKLGQLQGIQDTGKAILSVLDLEQLLTVIMNTLSNVCRIHRAVITLVNEKEACLEYLYATGFEGHVPEEVKKYKVPLHHVNNILVRVTNTGKPEYIPNARHYNLYAESATAGGAPTAVFIVPLITRSKVIGVIATDTGDSGGIPPETRDTLDIFAPQIAIAIENARLYNRLQEQMLELKKSHNLLRRAEKFSFMGNLAARLAHEIKNPMTAIGTFIQMLPHQFNDEEYRQNFYQVALEETARVNNLISELLDLVNTRENRFEKGDLHGLIDKMVLLVSPQGNAKKIRFIRRFDPRINRTGFDSEKMKQVILNLLSNAVEFTPEGGRIEISTRQVKGPENGKGVRIEIKDNGEGIPPSEINKVFDPYFTTKHKSSLHSGTGLGLFIAHQNVRDHGGTIEVQSLEKKGTTFILTLPENPV